MEGKGGALGAEGAQLRPRRPSGAQLYLRERSTASTPTNCPVSCSSITFSPCYCHCLVWGEKEGLEGRG